MARRRTRKARQDGIPEKSIHRSVLEMDSGTLGNKKKVVDVRCGRKDGKISLVSVRGCFCCRGLDVHLFLSVCFDQSVMSLSLHLMLFLLSSTSNALSLCRPSPLVCPLSLACHVGRKSPLLSLHRNTQITQSRVLSRATCLAADAPQVDRFVYPDVHLVIVLTSG